MRSGGPSPYPLRQALRTGPKRPYALESGMESPDCPQKPRCASLPLSAADASPCPSARLDTPWTRCCIQAIAPGGGPFKRFSSDHPPQRWRVVYVAGPL
jgi:hypothetical protein